MSDEQRKRACRISFAVFALLPTLLVGIWIVQPHRSHRWEQLASDAIGWEVTADRIIERSDGETSMLQVKVADAQLGDAARINHLQVTDSHDCLTLIGDHLELNAGQTATFFADLIRRFLLRPKGEVDQASLLFHRVTILNRASSNQSHETRSASSGQTFEDVEIQFTRNGERTNITMMLRPAGEVDEERIQLEIDVQRQDMQEPVVRWSLSTGRSYFPCALARQWLPFVERLGADASFRGQVKAVQSDGSWTAEASGHLSSVDLYELVSVPLHHTLNGFVDIDLVRFRLEAGRIFGAAGRIRCTDGQVSGTIIESMTEHFGWRQATIPLNYPTRFRELDIGFRTDGQWLEVRGDEAAQGVIAYDLNGQPWLYEGEQSVVPTTALLRALVPISDTEVPLTRETASLVNLLPLPSQSTTTPSSSGTSRIRLDAE